MATKTYLVIGATGTQGGSTVKALLKSAESPIQILAVTRNTTSSKAQSLAQDPRVHLLQGDPSSPAELFKSANCPQIDGVFCVTVHGPPGSEESQANGLIDASITHHVKHFVFTSADRGGEVVSDTNPTPVAHIATKYRIEQYLKSRTRGTSTSWTILRPTTFMDNLTNDFAGKGFAAMWKQVGQKPVQLVAASDIGSFAAKALLDPEGYRGRAIGIAGDELNFEQACKVFKETMNQELPQTFCVVGTMVKTVMGDIGAMFKWFEKDGYNVDIAEARRVYPGLQDFGAWLRNESQFAKKD